MSAWMHCFFCRRTVLMDESMIRWVMDGQHKQVQCSGERVLEQSDGK